jgi:hypothetical protein
MLCVPQIAKKMCTTLLWTHHQNKYMNNIASLSTFRPSSRESAQFDGGRGGSPDDSAASTMVIAS